MITIIAAMSEKGVIGKDGRIPWKISADIKRFAKLTTGHTVVMGRKTFESIPPKFRPLPNRNNIVLTSNPNYQSDGIEICQSTDVLLDVIFKNIFLKKESIFIIGGASLYNFYIPFADKLELTFVDGEYEGDTFFPPFFRVGDELTFDQHNVFTRIKFEYPMKQAGDLIYSFQTFERV